MVEGPPRETDIENWTTGVVENKGKNYTWSQSISDVSIILPIPEGTTGKQVDWSIKATSIKFGIRGQTPLLEGELYGAIKPDESAWTVGTY